MACLHSTFVGECTLFEEGVEFGCDAEGICVCEDDPTPAHSCESFECSTCQGNGCEECEDDYEDEEDEED